jgi:cytochrome c peroxidase
MTKTFLLAIAVVFTLTFISCSEEVKDVTSQGVPVLDESYVYENPKLPEGLNAANTFVNFDPALGIPVVNNPSSGGGVFVEGGIPIFGNFNEINRTVVVTNAGAALGRVLFYDKSLSLNNTISCSSCHHQDKAFADGQVSSPGFEGKLTSRNSMAILNPITQNNLFWDSRSQSIHDLSLRPVQNHIEMGMENMEYLTRKLSEIDYYGPLFTKAYGSNEISSTRISDALSQFIASITTADSRFDKSLKSGGSPLTELENLGKNVFFSSKAKCSSCHSGANFSAPDGVFDPYGGGFGGGEDLRGTANIGLELLPKDSGLGEGKFKIPSLRNITLTAPYMHDGRFKTLEEVLDHYTGGIKATAALDPKFKDANGKVRPIPLTPLEKKAVIAFLGTLQDDVFTKDPKYSDPFKK